jgi:hypothetical protein
MSVSGTTHLIEVTENMVPVFASLVVLSLFRSVAFLFPCLKNFAICILCSMTALRTVQVLEFRN